MTAMNAAPLQPLQVIPFIMIQARYGLTGKELQLVERLLTGKERRLAGGGHGYYRSDLDEAVDEVRKAMDTGIDWPLP
jgi:hypothetical protein